jgi:hypothetical protein
MALASALVRKKAKFQLIESNCIVTTIALPRAAHGGNARTAPAAPAAAAQDRAPTGSTAAAAAPCSGPTAWEIGPFDVSGGIDGYYSLGFNHLADHGTGLRNFDEKANRTDLNMALPAIHNSPKPTGFHLVAGAPIGKHFNAGFQPVGGWSNIVAGATFKMGGWTGSWKPTSKITCTNTDRGGPGESPSNRRMRGVYDAVPLNCTGGTI